MTSDLEESVARAMETEVRLLPLLPELLVDLWELGTSADQIVSVLRPVGLEPESTVLDLGCGKGAVAVALAERLDLRVEGIDAFPPFLESARTIATERGVSSKCLFRQGDIRKLLGQSEEHQKHYDVVLLLSVGPVSGDHEKTITHLRRLVRPGGYFVIEDGFLADSVVHLPGCEGYACRSETLRRLTSCGDVLVQEIVCSAEETRAMNETNTSLIRRRARLLRAKHPDLADLIDNYVATQERETQILGTDLICAVWILRRV